MDKTTLETNLYTVLGLQPPALTSNRSLSKDEIKNAYRRTLLLHHPDKAIVHVSAGQAEKRKHQQQNGTHYSIDEIMRAYQILSDPVLRNDYDEQFLRKKQTSQWFEAKNKINGMHLGIEFFDLDDLVYNENNGSWSKPCRCGNERGFVVTESELEEEQRSGEIYVGCEGCSLFIKVLFAASVEP